MQGSADPGDPFAFQFLFRVERRDVPGGVGLPFPDVGQHLLDSFLDVHSLVFGLGFERRNFCISL